MSATLPPRGAAAGTPASGEVTGMVTSGLVSADASPAAASDATVLIGVSGGETVAGESGDVIVGEVAAKEEAPPRDDEAVRSFDPGRLGMDIDPNTGIVHVIHHDSQAALQGVAESWRILAVEGEAYTWDGLLKRIRQDTLPYKITFGFPSHRVPRVLFIHSPNGARHCEGRYDLVHNKGDFNNIITEKCPNGMRMWKKTDDDLWLYSSKCAGWIVGGNDAKRLKFACNRGYIASVAGHDYKFMPHELLGEWKRVDEFGDWSVDPAITVTRLPRDKIRRV
eukprot:TRINITY_DN55575_c0_g1_i1.p1 TRINITY_DN55575_c0_g1~~TRINITY_DN55575_c0_g1_i1.p1  ORF type:complete len:305 (-),score=37.39 TRINITY_DN55575_c0_g1_i1:202-1041(-)